MNSADSDFSWKDWFLVGALLSFELLGCASVRGGFAEGCRQKCRENYMDMTGRNECMKGCEWVR